MASGDYGRVENFDANPDYVEMEVIHADADLAPNASVTVGQGSAADASDLVNTDVTQLSQPGGPLSPGGNPPPNGPYAPAPRRTRAREPLDQNNNQGGNRQYDGVNSALETPQETALREAQEASDRARLRSERRKAAENTRREAEAKRLQEEAARKLAEEQKAQEAADKAAADKAKKFRTQQIVWAVIGIVPALATLGLLASPFLIWALLFGPGRKLVAGNLGLKTKPIDQTASNLEESIEINVLSANGDPVLVDVVHIFQNDGDARVSRLTVPGVGTWAVDSDNTVILEPVAPQTKSATIQYAILGVSGSGAPAESDPALITINFTQTPIPVAIDIPFMAADRTTDPDIDVPTLSKNPGFLGDVKLVAMDGTQSSSLTDSTGGTWIVDPDTQHVKFNLPKAGITVPSVKVKYLLKLGLGLSNTSEIAVTFPKMNQTLAPVAKNLVKSAASTPPVTRSGLVDFDIPADNGNFTGSVNLIDASGGKPMSVPGKDATGATVGTWTVSATNHITFTPIGTVPDSVLMLPATYVLTGPGGDSNHAALTINFPAPVTTPKAADISLTDCSRGLFTTFQVPAANATLGAISAVKLLGGTDPSLVPVNDPATGKQVGNWAVINDKTVQFQTVGFCTLDSAPIQYTVQVVGNITSSPGTLTATFTRKPEAFDASKTVSSRASAITNPVKIDFLSRCSIPEGFQSIAFSDGSADITVDGEGRWFLEALAAQNPTANFTVDVRFTGLSSTMSYTVTDKKGNKSNPANLTASFIMPMARNFLVAKSVVAKELVATDVLADNPSQLPKDPASVQLVALQDLGQDHAASTAYLRKDKRAMQVPGEGVWLVDDNGLIVFQTDDKFTGAPTPVMYRYADTSGNYSNPATIAIDPGLAAIDPFLKALAKQADSVFWASFRLNAIADPGDDSLAADEYITVTQTYAAAVGRLVSGYLHNPVAEADYTTAFNAWNKAGQPNDGLIDTCAALVDQATKGVTTPLVNRYWRLTMMVRMLVQANP